MSFAAIVIGLALIAYGVIILRRPWEWYLHNEVEPPSLSSLFDRLPFVAAANAQRRAHERAARVQREYLQSALDRQRAAFEKATARET